MRYSQSIADRLSKAGWSCRCVPYFEAGSRIYVAETHRNDGQRFIVRADEKLAAFVELERLTVEADEKRSLGTLNLQFPRPSAATVEADYRR